MYLGNKIQLVKSKSEENSILLNYIKTDKFYKKSFLDIYNGDFDKTEVKDKIVII
jgi:CHASE2 domain-containing sensor protein